MKYATACYIPSVINQQKFVNHLKVFPTWNPLRVFTHDSVAVEGLDITTLPEIGPFPHGALDRFNRPADRYGFWAFLHCMTRMAAKGVTWCIWLETDCRMGRAYWDSPMFDSVIKHDHAVIGGTPVVWHAQSRGPVWSMRLIEFAYRYSRVAGCPMAWEGAANGPEGLRLYPNGAFAVYYLPDILEFFADAIHLLDAPASVQAELAAHYVAFDYYIGLRLVQKYDLDLVDRFAVTPTIYSGCGNFHYTEAERLEMLRRGVKWGVHQVKSASYG